MGQALGIWVRPSNCGVDVCPCCAETALIVAMTNPPPPPNTHTHTHHSHHLLPAVEPIFPPELRKRVPAELALPGPRCDWYRPLSLARLLAIKAQHPHAKLVVGNTGGLPGLS